MIVTTGKQFEDARIAVDDDRAPVDAFGDVFDAGYRAGSEVVQQRIPVEWIAIRQAQRQSAVGDEPIRPASSSAQFARRCAEDVAARAVELSHAPEPGRVRDVSNSKVGG